MVYTIEPRHLPPSLFSADTLSGKLDRYPLQVIINAYCNGETLNPSLPPPEERSAAVSDNSPIAGRILNDDGVLSRVPLG